MVFEVDVVLAGRSSSRGAPLPWPAELVFRSPPSDVRACSVGEETSAMGLLESWWSGGEAAISSRSAAVISLRSACTSDGSHSSALVLPLVRLGSACTAGRRSCAALDDRAGGGRCYVAPPGLALASLTLRLVEDGWRARRCRRAPSTASPSMLAMQRDDVRLPEAV